MPIDSTIAMLNLDMVGRSQRRAWTSAASRWRRRWSGIWPLRRRQPAAGCDIRRQGPGAGRSDDSSFIAKRIPAINFFTGFHADYHRPGDDWEKIDAAGTARVATLALELAARIAARSDTARVRLSRDRLGGTAPAVPLRRPGLGAAARAARANDLQLLAQHQPAAVQARLQRLILQLSRVLASSVVSPWMSRSTTGAR